MITLTREEAQQVLDALGSCEEDWIYDGEDEHPVDVYDKEKVGNAFVLLKNRLAQPEWDEDYRAMYLKVRDELAELQQREWQGLTDEERLRCFDDVDWNKVDWCPDHEQYAKAIEAKLKEKNT